MPVLAFSLPGVFIGLAGVMLLLAMAALWQSLRSAFGGGPPQQGLAGGPLDERSALLEEKKTLLRAIKDIQFEREVGKISDEDFQRLDKAYRRRAKEVLRLLDQDLGEFLGEAERMIADAMGEESGDAYRGGAVKRRKKTGKAASARKGAPRKRAKGRAASADDRIECPSCGAKNAADAVFCKECAARVAPIECAACGATNDADARFCKACAKSLGDEEPAAAGAAAGAVTSGARRSSAESSGGESSGAESSGAESSGAESGADVEASSADASSDEPSDASSAASGEEEE